MSGYNCGGVGHFKRDCPSRHPDSNKTHYQDRQYMVKMK